MKEFNKYQQTKTLLQKYVMSDIKEKISGVYILYYKKKPVYVGSSKDMLTRCYQHLTGNSNTAHKIKDLSNVTARFLECDISEMKELEEFLTLKYNTHVDGWNVNVADKVVYIQDARGKRIANLKNEPQYKVTTPEGSVIYIKNLNEFCRFHNLNQPNMVSVAAGRLKQHKNYSIQYL